MPAIGLPPAFIPPVVVLPAASAVVPVVAGAAATGVALPVLPLVGAVVAGAAVAGLASLAVAAFVGGLQWGQVNSRPRPSVPQVFAPITGTTTPDGNTAPGTWVHFYGPITYRLTDSSCEPLPTASYAEGAPSGIVRHDVVSVSAVRYLTNGCGVYGREITLEFSGGAPSEIYSLGRVGGGSAYASYEGPERFEWLGPNAVPLVDRPPGATYPDTHTQTEIQPEPLPAPAVAPPVPLPYAPTVAPEAEPTTQPAPTTPASPVVAPPVVKPAPVTPAATPTTTTPTTPAGQVQPAPLLPPVNTPTTVHVVNGTPIPANGPQATPQGIAQELGRIENKLARLLSPNPRGGPDLTDRLGLIWSSIQAIAEIINSASASGEYRISSPCVLDDDGQRVERVVEFDGALTAFGVLQNRMDALAALLQEHKDLKQPICRETPATGGQAVTVNFVQID